LKIATLKRAIKKYRSEHPGDPDSWVWEDWVRSEADEKALLAGYYPSPQRAQHVKDFFENTLVHSTGQFSGSPFLLLDWEWLDVIRPLFGWLGKNETRRYRRAYISMAKKNGKSSLMSGVGLYGLIADGEPNSQVFSAAADKGQAAIIYGESVRMITQSKTLSVILKPIRSQKEIIHEASESLYKALSADVPTKEGLNAHYVMFDELHAQPHRRLYDVLRFAGRARRQPLFIITTTAGFDRHSICFEQYRRHQQVEEGIIDDLTAFTYIAEAPKDADITDPATWRIANPSFDDLFDEDQFAQDAKEADESITLQNRFRRYCLNQWTEQDERFIRMDKWDACNDELGDLTGVECWGGLDLASTTDIAAFVLYFPGETNRILPFFWIPEDGARYREDRDHVPYTEWIAQGFIRTTEGDVTDYDVIREDILTLKKQHNIRDIAIDGWNSTQLQTQLGGENVEVTKWGQGFRSMAAPTKEAERLIVEGNVAHADNPVLRWMANNLAVETDPAGNWKPSKKKSTEKIDGMVAWIMALGLSMISEPKKVSKYAKKGARLASIDVGKAKAEVRP